MKKISKRAIVLLLLLLLLLRIIIIINAVCQYPFVKTETQILRPSFRGVRPSAV